MTTLKREELKFDYNDEDDILYVSLIGRAGSPAITCETTEGHLVRIDPESHELIGAEIIGYRERWLGRDIQLEWKPPRRLWQRGHHHEGAVFPAPRGLLVG